MENLGLQWQLSNGDWTDCNERTDEFLTKCEKNNGMDASGQIVPIWDATRPLTRDEVVAVLMAGKTLRNDPEEWYSNCRSGTVHKAAVRAQMAEDQARAERWGHSERKYMVCRQCGQRGYTGAYPFSTAPRTGLCDDCV
jgi:hypothetical protein